MGRTALVVMTAAYAALALLAACSDSTSPSYGPPGPGTPVAVEFCADEAPNWVAFQDGDGAWTEARPTASGTRVRYEQTFNANRGGVAIARVFSHALTALSVQYGMPAELAIVGDTTPLHCGGPIATALLGTIAGLDTNEEASIAAGLSIRAFVPPAGDHAFALEGLTPGPQEILAARTTRLSATTTAVTRLILRRTATLPDSATLPVFDFNSAEAFEPATGTVTLTGLGPEGASVNTLIRTAHSQSIVSIGQNDMSAPVRSFLALPEAQLEAGDLQILSAASGPVQTGVIRTATVYLRAPVQQTLTLGPAIVTPTFTTVATTPSLRLRAHVDDQSEYDRFAAVTYQEANTVVSVAMTAGYAALTGAGYDLVIPDLSHAAGFDPSWALQPGSSLFWTMTRTGGTLGLGLGAIPFEGATSRSAFVVGTLPQ